MTTIKTTKTINLSVEEFKRMIGDKCFAGKDVDINFLIREVGGDPLDRFPGHKKVVSVEIKEEIMSNATQPMRKEKIVGATGSYFQNNLVIRRDEDEGLLVDGRGEDVTVYLNGYAIIPIEKYYEMKGEPVPAGSIQKIEMMRKRLNEA